VATGAAHHHARAIADCGLESEGGFPPSNGTSLLAQATSASLHQVLPPVASDAGSEEEYEPSASEDDNDEL